MHGLRLLPVSSVMHYIAISQHGKVPDVLKLILRHRNTFPLTGCNGEIALLCSSAN